MVNNYKPHLILLWCFDWPVDTELPLCLQQGPLLSGERSFWWGCCVEGARLLSERFLNLSCSFHIAFYLEGDNSITLHINWKPQPGLCSRIQSCPKAVWANGALQHPKALRSLPGPFSPSQCWWSVLSSRLPWKDLELVCCSWCTVSGF